MPKSELDITEGLTKEEAITTFDSRCIRQKSNMSQSSAKYRFDSGSFEVEVLLNDMKIFSPKLDKLLDKIEELDKKDEKKYGKKFKHFIFSDLKSAAYGPKLISSGLISKGYHLGYTANKSSNNEKSWGPMKLLDDSELKKTRESNFYLLSSVSVYDKPISSRMKKDILAKFNQRPENINGELARIIVMDSGFKEGIDLFDIKYIHIFEPSINMADQKQVIGRGTRTCGQKGLDFHPNKGWPLHVFIYDLEFPKKYKSNFLNSDTAFELYMKSLNIDARLMNFTSELEEVSVYGSVDYELNQNVHRFTIDQDSDSDDDSERIYGGNKMIRNKTGSKFQQIRDLVNDQFRQFTWEPVKMENTCITPPDVKRGGATAIEYTPTQDFIRNYFSLQAPVKGMLLYHSVGTGKTCSAIAAASKNFELQGYTILWVTRTTLKNDIWKNMFSQICNESLRNKVDEIPTDPKKQKAMLSKSWRIRPMSYKQFSNLISKENDFYRQLVKINGKEDPLRKTLLIIDEAHKLYGGSDLSSIERPDMVAFHKALMHSYAVSGNDSVRLLLMTATPITENPMELIQLMNLCKPIKEQLPGTFESFKNEYLDANGRFTDNGRSKYLDDIAGHISYLNREKDARQFAQPIVKRVLVNVTDENLIQKFDKGLIKDELDHTILDLKTKTIESMKELEGDISEIDANRFAHLKKRCQNTSLKERTCQKIVKHNIKDLVNEIKTYKKTIKDRIKEIKDETKTATIYKQDEMQKIKKNIDRFPEEYDKYKKSAFFLIKTECGSTVKTNQEVLEELEEHPEIQKYTNNIKQHQIYIDQLKESLKVDADAFKLKMRELKELLKTDLNDIERSTIKMIIRENDENYKHVRLNLSKKIHKGIKENKGFINELRKKKKEKYKKVQKSLKQMLKKGRKEEKKKEKEVKLLRKTLRKQGELEDDIKDVIIRDMVDKQQIILDKELEREEGIKKREDEEKEEKMKEKEKKIKEKEMKREKREEKKVKANETRILKEKSKQNKTKKNKGGSGLGKKIISLGSKLGSTILTEVAKDQAQSTMRGRNKLTNSYKKQNFKIPKNISHKKMNAILNEQLYRELLYKELRKSPGESAISPRKANVGVI